MGNFIFSVTKCTSNSIPPSIKPSSYNWLSIHSAETGLSLIDVQRLWIRFQQLGCDINNGIWTSQSVLNSNYKIKKDEFQKKIIAHLHAPDQQYVTFYDFLNAVLWLENSSSDEKLRASFAIINENNPITLDSLTATLILMFPGKKKEDINRYAQSVFEMLGVDNPKTNLREICEEDFIFFLKSAIPRQKLDEIFQFTIASHLKPIINQSPVTEQKPSDHLVGGTINSSIPTDEQLEEIARLVGERDHSKLAAILGILQYDLNHLENVYRNNKMKIVYSVLREWKQKQGARASFDALKRALSLSGFIDIFNRIEFG